MTNEEKARELIGCPCPTKIRNCEACFDRIKVLEMAEWKEQQMIERAVEWIRYYNENGGCEFDEWEDVFRREMMEE